jgi:hypothetical protein
MNAGERAVQCAMHYARHSEPAGREWNLCVVTVTGFGCLRGPVKSCQVGVLTMDNLETKHTVYVNTDHIVAAWIEFKEGQ